jgi:hypothetical protein
MALSFLDWILQIVAVQNWRWLCSSAPKMSVVTERRPAGRAGGQRSETGARVAARVEKAE